jgi:hypothetical protein
MAVPVSFYFTLTKSRTLGCDFLAALTYNMSEALQHRIQLLAPAYHGIVASLPHSASRPATHENAPKYTEDLALIYISGYAPINRFNTYFSADEEACLMFNVKLLLKSFGLSFLICNTYVLFSVVFAVFNIPEFLSQLFAFMAFSGFVAVNALAFKTCKQNHARIDAYILSFLSTLSAVFVTYILTVIIVSVLGIAAFFKLTTMFD